MSDCEGRVSPAVRSVCRYKVRLLPALLFASVSVIASKDRSSVAAGVVRAGFPRALSPLDEPSALSNSVGLKSRYRQGGR